jgi:hypothetical protein
LSYLGSFKAYEEWTEARPSELGKAWKDLDDIERGQLDAWIIRQFYLKNCDLLERQVGIHVIDRTPLDPISFTDEAGMPAKAQSIAGVLSPGRARRGIQDGHVIVLTGDPNDMEARVVGRHKQSKADLIQDMQGKICRIFDSGSATSVVNTWGLSIPEVVKRVARIILLEEYKPLDLTGMLMRIRSGGLPATSDTQ